MKQRAVLWLRSLSFPLIIFGVDFLCVTGEIINHTLLRWLVIFFLYFLTEFHGATLLCPVNDDCTGRFLGCKLLKPETNMKMVLVQYKGRKRRNVLDE